MSISIAGDLPGIYDVFADPITINGNGRRGIQVDGFVDPGGFGVSSTRPTMRVIASENFGLAAGAVLVHAGVTYRVFDLQPIEPDKLETRLVLERQ
jgi:hypothetical protein